MVNYLEHDNLVSELKNLEDFNPQERLEHAKKRRKQQLESYTTRGKGAPLTQASHDKRIHFQPNICLIESSARNDADEVREFMLNNMSPDLQNEDGLSALHQAVIEDCADVVSVLIEHGGNLNIKDADLWTPLHAAVACGNYELVKFLIENGASLIEINTDGNMPIDLIEENEDLEVLFDESMVNAGYTELKLEEIRSIIPNEMLTDLKDSLHNDRLRDLDIIGEHGETACHIACANGYVEVLEFLLDNGARFDIGDKDKWQPIHAAACWGHDKIIEILVNHGADLEARTIDGETPFDLTEDEDMQEMLIELKQHGNNKMPKVRRTQSNTSRTLSVRRSSIVEKRQTSISDAKQEGIVRATPELLHVDIKTDDDFNLENGSDISSEGSVFQSTEVENQKEKHSPLDKKGNTSTTDEKENSIMNADLNNETLLNKPKPTDDCVVNITPLEEKITVTNEDTETIQKGSVIPPSQEHASNKLTQSNQNYNNAENTKDHNNIDIEIAECVPSHNTAAKNENNQKQFNNSDELVIKKKCCVIL